MASISNTELSHPKFDFEVWLKNFTDAEPFNLAIEDAKLSDANQEVLSLIKKDGTYDSVIAILNENPIDTLYDWIINPTSFPLVAAVPGFDLFLMEFIPYFIISKNHWSPKQFGVELKHYMERKEFRFKSPRLKKCTDCGVDLSDEFAVNLTADAILDGIPVTVVCPHCHKINKFETGF